jgi:hypothetical protein
MRISVAKLEALGGAAAGCAEATASSDACYGEHWPRFKFEMLAPKG